MITSDTKSKLMTLYEIGEMVCAVSFGHSFKMYMYLNTVKQEEQQKFKKMQVLIGTNLKRNVG